MTDHNDCQTAKPTDGGWAEREAEIIARFDERFNGVYYGRDLDGCPIEPPDGFKADVKDFILSEVSTAVLAERQRCVEAVEKSTERWRTNHETGGVEALLLAVEAINGKGL